MNDWRFRTSLAALALLAAAWPLPMSAQAPPPPPGETLTVRRALALALERAPEVAVSRAEADDDAGLLHRASCPGGRPGPVDLRLRGPPDALRSLAPRPGVRRRGFGRGGPRRPRESVGRRRARRHALVRARLVRAAEGRERPPPRRVARGDPAPGHGLEEGGTPHRPRGRERGPPGRPGQAEASRQPVGAGPRRS